MNLIEILKNRISERKVLSQADLATSGIRYNVILRQGRYRKMEEHPFMDCKVSIWMTSDSNVKEPFKVIFSHGDTLDKVSVTDCLTRMDARRVLQKMGRGFGLNIQIMDD